MFTHRRRARDTVLLLAVFEAILYAVYLYWGVSRALNRDITQDIRAVVGQSLAPRPAFLILSALLCALMVFTWDAGRFEAFAFRNRYRLAAAAFILCVAFGVSGSSVGCVSYHLRGADPGVLLGVNRPVRSDEWAVWTPMVASQYLDPAGPFAWFSSVVRAGMTDVFLGYGTPVRTWVILFRPFLTGFLFLPLANGMAFFWMGRQIALLMASFEFGRLLTGDDRRLSLLYALMVAFAPAVEWWFAICGLPEMLLYIQLFALALKKYLSGTRFAVRAGCAAAMTLCLGGYVLTAYPAWMIPLCYVLLVLAGWIVATQRPAAPLGARDALLALAAVGALAGMGFTVLHNSGGTLEIIRNTVYPGARVSTGGGCFQELFTGMTNLWTGLMVRWTPSNQSENATLLSLFPLSLLLLAALTAKGRRDGLCFALFGAELLLGLYCAAGFPLPLAKLTLLNYSPAQRARIAFHFCDMLLLFRALHLLRGLAFRRRAFAALAGIAAAVACAFIRLRFPGALPGALLALTGLVTFLLGWGLAGYAQSGRAGRAVTLLVAAVVAVSGLAVNPVRAGFDSVENLPELQMIREIAAEDPEAKWIVEGTGIRHINLPLLAGARTVNSTNIYPMPERWAQFDPEGRYADVYNRYAHIAVDIVDGDAGDKFTLLEPDAMRVTLTPAEVQALGVRYVLTPGALDDARFTEIAAAGAFRVYRAADP